MWQIGVAPEAAGKGLGGRMLDALVDRENARGATVRFMESTVTPTNAASRALFAGFARRRDAPMKVTDSAFAVDDFPSDADHEAEDRFVIGPF